MSRVTTSILASLFLALPAVAQLEPLTGWAQEGRVEITAIHGWGVAVGIDTFNKQGEADGLIDRVYLLQAYGPKPAELPRAFESAMVLETESGIRVVSEADKLDFRLELANGEDALFGSQGIEADGVHRYRGFGLSRVDALKLAFPLETSWLAAYPLPDLRAPTAVCSSGGAGSTSCSVSNPHGGCSISCATGYTACCINAGWASGASCSCTPASGGGGGTGGGGGGGGGGASSCRYDANGFCSASCMSCSLY